MDEGYGRFGSCSRVEAERFFHLDDEDRRLIALRRRAKCVEQFDGNRDDMEAKAEVLATRLRASRAVNTRAGRPVFAGRPVDPGPPLDQGWVFYTDTPVRQTVGACKRRCSDQPFSLTDSD